MTDTFESTAHASDDAEHTAIDHSSSVTGADDADLTCPAGPNDLAGAGESVADLLNGLPSVDDAGEMSARSSVQPIYLEASEEEYLCLEKFLGLGDLELALFRLDQLMDALPPQMRASFDPEHYRKIIKSICATLRSVAPRDEFEVELVQQRIATHFASLGAYRMAIQDSLEIEVRDIYWKHAERFADRHLKTQAALDKYRGGGKQGVSVTRHHVNEGANAIVGAVEVPPVRKKSPKRAAAAARLEQEVLPPDPLQSLEVAKPAGQRLEKPRG